MYKKNIFKAALLIMATALPLQVYAVDAVEKVGDALQRAGQSIATAASDTEITTKLKARLAMESDIPLNISVKTVDGVVYLGGEVDTDLQAHRMVQLAKDTKNVRAVNASDVKVLSSTSYFNDMTITMVAKYELLRLGLHNLQVETTNNVVHIFGNVANKDEAKAAKEAVAKISDVKDVKTNIQVN